MRTVAAEIVAPDPFAQLVSLACHDLRTPLATASGFARTLQRLDQIEDPADRYVEMIGAAADQMAALLDLLSAAARVEDGRFEPDLRTVGSRDLADAAAKHVESGRMAIAGEGADVETDIHWATLSLSALAEAVRRHGLPFAARCVVSDPEPGLAAELYSDGIAVNVLSPSGLVKTPGVDFHGLTRGVPDELIEKPEEFAETALWLCTGDPAERTGRIDYSRQLQAEIVGQSR